MTSHSSTRPSTAGLLADAMQLLGLARLARARGVHLHRDARGAGRAGAAGRLDRPPFRAAPGRSGIISPGARDRGRRRESEKKRGLSGHLRPDHEWPPGPRAPGGGHLRPRRDRHRLEPWQGAALHARRARRACAESAGGTQERHRDGLHGPDGGFRARAGLRHRGARPARDVRFRVRVPAREHEPAPRRREWTTSS